LPAVAKAETTMALAVRTGTLARAAQHLPAERTATGEAVYPPEGRRRRAARRQVAVRKRAAVRRRVEARKRVAARLGLAELMKEREAIRRRAEIRVPEVWATRGTVRRARLRGMKSSSLVSRSSLQARSRRRPRTWPERPVHSAQATLTWMN